MSLCHDAFLLFNINLIYKFAQNDKTSNRYILYKSNFIIFNIKVIIFEYRENRGVIIMFRLLKKRFAPHKFDRNVLRKNDISILILDERWNSLFNTIDKTPEILKCEQEIKNKLKEQARLTAELKEIPNLKKELVDKILRLTEEAFDKNNNQAKKEIKLGQKRISQLNDRIKQIESELNKINDSIKELNIELVEYTINAVYFKIRREQKRKKQLEKLITETRKKLMEYIDEKESLTEDYNSLYSYFHDLLGNEELERLDKIYILE